MIKTYYKNNLYKILFFFILITYIKLEMYI